MAIVGRDIKSGNDVGISQTARQQGLYVIGANGTGKSTLLANMILSDITQGFGVCLIEPHGDLTKSVLSRIPEKRRRDVILLDMMDSDYPFGLNLFQSDSPTNMIEAAKTASFVMHVFEKVWRVGTDTPQLAQVLRNVTRTLIENPGTTFAEIPLLLWEEPVREKFLANLKNPQTQMFWKQYNLKSTRDRDAYISSTINKVDAYLNEPLIANIVSQERTTIAFRKIMDEGKILLVQLSPQLEEMSRLLGSILIGQLLHAAFSRADTPEEDRRQFNLYCDEYQRFATSDFATLISEARKFRIATTLSHQTLAQLDSANMAAAIASGNHIVFRVSGEDARTLAKNFDIVPTQEVIGQEPVRAPTNDAITFLLKKSHSDPDAIALNRYLEFLLEFAEIEPDKPKMAKVKNRYPNPRGSAVESVMEGIGDAAAVMFFNFLDKRKYKAAQQLKNDAKLALIILNDYFAEVMLKRNNTIPIPKEVIKLFGHKQFLNCESLTSRPECMEVIRNLSFAQKNFAISELRKVGYSGREDEAYNQMVEFLAATFIVAKVLAENPILVETGQYQPRYQTRTYADMEGEMANSLTNQPNYQARVKTIAGEWVIKTQRLPERNSASFPVLLKAIQQQTRETYCTPRETVEQAITKRQTALQEVKTPPTKAKRKD